MVCLAVDRWRNTTTRSVIAERCALAHDLINDLAIIVGDCDILAELLKKKSLNLEQADAIVVRAQAIKATAMRMADRIETRPCPAVRLVPRLA